VNRRASQNKSSGVVAELRREKREEIHRFPIKMIGSVMFPVVIRFKAVGTNASVSATRGGILSIFLSGCTSTTASRIMGSVRIRKIEGWNAQDTASTNVAGFPSLCLEWNSVNNPGTVLTDTGYAMRPAHVEGRPPKDSLAGYWSSNGTNESEVLFKVYANQQALGVNPCSSGTIIDLHLECLLLDDEGVTVLSGLSSVVPGQNYVCDFTGSRTGSSYWNAINYFQL